VRPFRTLLIFWIPLIAWLALIHLFSSIPGRYLPHLSIPYADKIFHIAEYFVLVLLMMRAFENSYFNVSLAKSAVLAIIISLCYGTLDELFQRSVPGRAFDIFDIFADCSGLCIGALTFLYEAGKEGGKLASDKAVQGNKI
jgi:VanZ family protein